MDERRKQELQGVVFLGLAILVFLSLVSFSASDIGILQEPPQRPLENLVGIGGAYLGVFLYFLLGLAAYLIPLFTLSLAGVCFSPRAEINFPTKLSGYLLITLALSTLFSLQGIGSHLVGGIFKEPMMYAGGLIGYFLSGGLVSLLGRSGSYILISLFLITGVIIATPFLFSNFLTALKLRWGRMKSVEIPAPKKVRIYTPAVTKRVVEEVPKSKKEEPLEAKAEKEPEVKEVFSLPPLSLLNDPPEESPLSDSYVQENSRKLEQALEQFGVQAEVVNVQKGPVITSYELQPGTGVKVSQIVTLSDDIALALRAKSVRIVAPVPGRAVLSIEMPNPHPRFVYLKEVIDSESFRNSSSLLTLALGKDIKGEPLVSDLRQMPHLLIAGTTGSGKTVCLHSLITSILFKAYPYQVKLLLVDPKMVELTPFSQIPHLFAPVVTQVKEAPAALQWIVEEMEGRYIKLADAGVRNIENFNAKMESQDMEQERLPFIVVIVDELADLMTVASRKVEAAVQRIAQLSRAAGIHLILATQRPSVDVITGVIKANFPYRISFQVSSQVDSRTVLDRVGANKLLGRGDMLYLPAGESKPIRAQSPLIVEEEIERVVKFWENLGQPEFHTIEFGAEKEKIEKTTLPGEKDPLFKEAVKVILETGQASASHLQRRMSIGYARAGRLIDLMEEQGIICPAQGPKPREVFIDESYLEKLEDSRNETKKQSNQSKEEE